MATQTAPKDRIKASWLLAYSLPGLPIAALGLPLAVHLPNFYAVEVGLGYAVVGWIFGAARFFDVFLDPVMGVVSDSVRTRWGRRRIWMVLSIPIMLLASVLVFMPSPGVSATYVVAGLLYGLAAGQDLTPVIALAQRCGALATTAKGAMTALPWQHEL